MADAEKSKKKSKPATSPAKGAVAPAKSAPAKADKGKTGEKKARKWGKPRNYELTTGVMRFSRSRMYKKRALWKKKKGKQPEAPKSKKRTLIKKEIGGEKNGGVRMVRIKKLPKYYTVNPSPKKRDIKRPCFSRHRHALRKTLTPGTVCIVLAGRHKGKHVVFLKQLKRTGLLLVTGPHKLNGVPMRRINQIFVIATKTKIDISSVEVPRHIGDKYFKRQKPKKNIKKKKTDGDIFETKTKVTYEVTDQRKADQITVDKQVLQAIAKRDDKKSMLGYLKSYFRLHNNTYPHKMVF